MAYERYSLALAYDVSVVFNSPGEKTKAKKKREDSLAELRHARRKDLNIN